MSNWENNAEVLKNQYPGLLEDITRAEEMPAIAPDDIKIFTTPAGDPSLCVKGINIHSARDPSREGLRLAQAAASNGGHVVILGFGLGYSAEEFAKTTAASEAASRRPIIIVEKHRKLLVKAFEARDLSAFLSQNRIIFVIGGNGEEITNALSIADKLFPSSEGQPPAVIRNRALVDFDKEWYGVVEERLCTYSMKDDVNSATLKRFGRRWVRNLSRNIGAIRDYAGISRLAGLAGGGGVESVPVFLAAAGPSLDKARPLLREIHKRCVTVAVDTSFRFFTDNGVQPDFVLVVDPQFWNSRHLDRCPCGHTALIAESAVYPPVMRLPFATIFLCGSLFPLGSFVEKQVDPKGQLGAGGSVSTTAWDFARSLGAKEIWIAGLDLAFPDFKTHFRGAAFETRANAFSTRFSPAETWVVRALRDGAPFKAPRVSGGQVLTDRRLSLYAAWFENRFRMHGEVKNYGVFQDGLAIEGVCAMDAETFLSLPERRAEIDRRLQTAFSQIENDFNNPVEKQKRSVRYEKAVSALIRGLESVGDAARKGAEITRLALNGNVNPERRNKILKDLDEIMRRITESEVKEVAGFLFPSDESEGKAEDAKKDPFRAYLESSNKLFSSLSQTVEFNLQNLKY